ncbi:N(1)-aminopropylagmatine ureohydrolase [Pseudovibrio axinellae]|uniref:N(1)-aminopropylagmatine ureohydrolase n=1 Tax=Pseudovibrio axinellae TaxID=989403 RepID=A0A165WS81_9HYPH|nr:agmatinase [Pseudovibrio axinellae]KZL16833.1 N(1)-aminopropylagmatine ureohydrolase [Pseudovibrio axinellae]SER67514.1 agmatinase [Pseudovibrio axinellae]
MSIFLESELTQSERQEDNSLFTIIPMPLERTVSYGSGTLNGPEAILNASDELERGCNGVEPCAFGIFTEPAVECDGPLPEVMERLAKRTEHAVKSGKIPVTLGGEHSLSYGAVSGVARALGERIGIIQIDAHADLRVAYQGEKHSHASVMNLLAECGVRLAQFGVRALCQQEMDSRDEHGVFFVDAEELVTKGIHAVDLPEDFPEHVYISFDVDGLDPSQMPATGTPVPGGLGYYQALHLVEHALKGRKCVGLDVVELAPDGNAAWDFTAAQITYRLMAAAVSSRSDG